MPKFPPLWLNLVCTGIVTLVSHSFSSSSHHTKDTPALLTSNLCGNCNQFSCSFNAVTIPSVKLTNIVHSGKGNMLHTRNFIVVGLQHEEQCFILLRGLITSYWECLLSLLIVYHHFKNLRTWFSKFGIQVPACMLQFNKLFQCLPDCSKWMILLMNLELYINKWVRRSLGVQWGIECNLEIENNITKLLSLKIHGVIIYQIIYGTINLFLGYNTV